LLLSTFDPMYERVYAMRLKNGEINVIPPTILATWENAEWPDPDW